MDLLSSEDAQGPTDTSVDPEDAREHLLDFTRYTFIGFEESWHHVDLSNFLTRFAYGRIPRGMVFMPPRHSKSEFTSRRLPPFIFGRNPRARIMGTSYTATLADMMSRDAQRIIDSPSYRRLFPDTKLDGVVKNDYFEINGGAALGGGYYRAAGILGGIGGMGASFGLIDDPIKDAAEANSPTYRENLWEWYKSTFYPRLEQPGSILLTMTRWHEDDLAGRLLKQAREDPAADQWEVLNLQAIATKDEQARRIGDALWPGRFPIDRLQKIKITLGDWFEPLYQQNPGKPGGTIFQRAWFETVDYLPLRTSETTFCRFWDMAGTEKEKAKSGDPDWTVGTLMMQLKTGGPWFIVDVVRDRVESFAADTLIHETAKRDADRFGHVKTREEQEPGSAGKAVIASRRRRLAGYDYDGRPSTGEKTLRWAPLAGQSKAGNVKLLRGAWNHEFLEVLVRVPKAAHDDDADSASGAFNELTLGGGGFREGTVVGY